MLLMAVMTASHQKAKKLDLKKLYVITNTQIIQLKYLRIKREVRCYFFPELLVSLKLVTM